MSGTVSNARPGPSEATRYTYLHFGGLGVVFRAKAEALFVNLKGSPPGVKEQTLKLLADTPQGEEKPPFFEPFEKGEIEPPFSLCFPTRKPRYWYSGPKAKTEKLVYVYNSSASTSKVVYEGKVLYTSFGPLVLSASIIEDPIAGECLFVVSAFTEYASYPLGWESYAELLLRFPLYGTILNVRSKAVIRSWSATVAELSSELRGFADLGLRSGCHSLDGTKFVMVIHTSASGEEVKKAKVIAVDSAGVVSLEEEVAVEQNLNTLPSGYNLSLVYTEVPHPFAATEYFFESLDYAGFDNYESSGTILAHREVLHDGKTLDIFSSYTSAYARTSTYKLGPVASPHSSILGYTANSEDLLTLTLWEGVVIETSKSSETITVDHVHNPGEIKDYSVSRYIGTEYVDWAGDYDYKKVHSKTTRTVEVWCPHSKSVWMRCSTQNTTVEASRRDSNPLTDIGVTKVEKVWMELLVGSELIVFGEVNTESPQYDFHVYGPTDFSWALMPPVSAGAYPHRTGTYSDSSILGSGFMAGETPVAYSPMVTEGAITEGAGYDWAVNGAFAAKNAHMVGLNGKAIIAIPKYWYGYNYPSKVFSGSKPAPTPDPGNWLVRVLPTEGHQSSLTELSNPLTEVTAVYSVYPTD